MKTRPPLYFRLLLAELWYASPEFPLRLLELLSRLADLAATEYGDSFLKKVATEVDAKQDLVMTDRSAFYDYLGQLVVDFVKEAKRQR